MTCIIALAHEGKVYMGCDSASVSGWDVRSTTLSKVFRVSDFLIGYTSSFRMGQLLQYHLRVREREKDEAIMHYLVTGFVPAVRECLKEGGYTKIESNREESGVFLVGYMGEVFRVDSDFQVNSYSPPYISVGAGESYALGALAALIENTKGSEMEDIVMKALEISGRFSIGVTGPYKIMVL